MSMCLVRFSVTALVALKIAPWLSPHSGMYVNGILSSPMSECIHTNWRVVSDKDMYSASVEKRVTVFCALDNQEVTVPTRNTRCCGELTDAQSVTLFKVEDRADGG